MIIGDNDYFSMDDDLMLAKLSQEVKEEIAGVDQMRKLVNEERSKLLQLQQKSRQIQKESRQIQQENDKLQALLKANNIKIQGKD